VSGISLRVLMNDLPGLVDGMASRAAQIRRKAALDVEADWKAGVRVDTGALRASIAVTEETATSVSVGTNVEYAPFEEYGTRKMAGSFARTKAMDKNRGPFLTAMRSVVGR
jgi:phage gpG-like protein